MLDGTSYPEGNFGVNQLLGGSMSLSPLYQTLTNDLHVNNETDFHPGFPGLHHRLAKFTTFRVAMYRLRLEPQHGGTPSKSVRPPLLTKFGAPIENELTGGGRSPLVIVVGSREPRLCPAEWRTVPVLGATAATRLGDFLG